ncbi:MAG: hypothetical protein ACI9TH_000181 [Kiritimatiellia bacterium]|jgi:hypothetical protein
MKRIPLILILLLPLCRAAEYDLVIYGGTSAAVAAAVQAKRMNRSVIIVSPDKHLGGLSSGGLGYTDSGKKEAIGGISREVYQRIKKHYDQPKAWIHQKPEDYARYRKGEDAMWVFEPHVAEQVFEDLIKEYNIPVVRDAWLDRANGVSLTDGRITAIRCLDGKSYAGLIFMDTTYEGDLMAAAGVRYHVGRESNATYGETLNGVQTLNARKHQFDYPTDPYVIEGDPASGLLPRIQAGPPGKEGEGDHRVQAYNYRMCLTTVSENRIPFAAPAGYDRHQYALLARYLKGGWNEVFGKFDAAPNGKTDTNNHGAFSTDNIGMNYDYPDASYARRAEILEEHQTYQKGWLYFLANDPSVPEHIRTRMSTWGLPKDEFNDNSHWPHQIYVREARRMISDFVMTENHLRALKPTPASIGMGSYNMDSHNVQRYVNAAGHVRNEGDLQISPGGPYPISYQAIVPKRIECTNLLVPVCLSSSHMAYGSIRMEPVFMILGQSAATAAALAIEAGMDVQDVDYDTLSARLLADQQVLHMARKPKPVRQTNLDPNRLPGIVIDDREAKKTGDWISSAATGKWVGSGYLHDGNAGKGERSIVFSAELPAGKYEVRVAYACSDNRAKRVPVTLITGRERIEQHLDQRKVPGIDELFTSIGTYSLSGTTRIEISNRDTDGYVIADAVQFIKK